MGKGEPIGLVSDRGANCRYCVTALCGLLKCVALGGVVFGLERLHIYKVPALERDVLAQTPDFMGSTPNMGVLPI